MFTHDSVLEHTVGTGYTSRAHTKDHKSHHCSFEHDPQPSLALVGEERSHDRSKSFNEHNSARIQAGASGDTCDSLDVRLEELHVEDSLPHEGESTAQCTSSSSAACPSSLATYSQLTSVDLAKLRAEVAQTVARGSLGGQGLRCSSLFVLPLEWMSPFLVGCREGKVRNIS